MMDNLSLTGYRHRQYWPPEDLLRFSDGELHFLWHFIQGSIMNPETRWSLRNNWGMCDRHSFGFISAEAAYRHGFLMGQAVLYQDLMERAAAAFQAPFPIPGFTVAFRLREKEPCFMCKMGYNLSSRVSSATERLEEGRNLEPIRSLAMETAPLWGNLVCGICADNGSQSRCRSHLVSELAHGRANVAEHRATVQSIFSRVTRYMQSFIWDYRFEPTVEDRSALIESIGWLTGWRPWLLLLEEKPV